MDDSYDAVVIGGGIGGLTAGALLARKGLSVAVFEAHKKPGGYCTSFNRKGFKFDACLDAVSGGGEDGWLSRVLAKLGVKDKVELVRLDPLRVDRIGDEEISVPAGLEGVTELLYGLAPHEKEGIRGLMTAMDEIYKTAMVTPPEALYTDSRMEKRAGAPARYIKLSYRDLLDDFVKDEKVRAVLCDRSAFMGLPPSKVSAVAMAVMFMTYAVGGGYRIKDGAGRLADALVAGLEGHGGGFFRKSPVTGILSEGGKVTGVEVDGRKVSARAVVSAMDSYETARMAGYAHEPEELKPSVSFFLVYLGLEGVIEMPDSMGVYPGCDIGGTFADIDTDVVSPASSMEIVNYSRISPSMAPDGCTSAMLMAKAAYRYRDDWKACKEREMGRLIDKAEAVLPGIRKKIVHAEAATPMTLERYTGNSRGAAFGWEQGVGNARPGVRTPVGGLYLAGHWTYPGGGVESVAASGIIAAEAAAAGL